MEGHNLVNCTAAGTLIFGLIYTSHFHGRTDKLIYGFSIK
jgi:hypothetical protein